MSTSPVSYCWAMAATSPFASRLSRAAIAGSSRDGRLASTVTPRSYEARAARRVPGLVRAYHRGVSYARDERAALCALFDETGPQAPTLCAGWRTADLAAHLVLRERRPDAAVGILGGPLARHTQRVNQALAS